ncbi:MAG: ElyC/SanA/YdcF family protein [Candidatus Omnitrophota bacterium]|jgi:uncharacterized SAM-binding protein YcdF (DUF218 family)
MLQNENIICISSIDWDFIWQGHQEIMSALASNGNRVLFVENTGVRPPNLKDLSRLKKRVRNWLHSVKGIRKEKENLYIYSPLILPFPYSRVARKLNGYMMLPVLRRWLKSVGFSNPIIWTFLPTGIVLDIVDAIDNKLIVYYCIDNFMASSPQARNIKRTEDELLKRADIVFVTAKNLYDRCSKYNSNVHVFPYGVNMDVYEKINAGGVKIPEDMTPIKHPVVGYIGGIHKWIDFELVKFLAKAHTDKSFVFVGPLQRDISEFRSIPNVFFLGQKRYEELPYYVFQFDVCAIPYLLTEYTKNVYPTKINEYLSLGKPVISTAISEVEAFNNRNDDVIFIGRTKEVFSSLIDEVISDAKNESLCKKRATIAKEEGSWDVKIEKICGLVEGKIKEREKEKSLRWKENILKLYRRSRRNLVPALAALLLAYLMLFHTPLVWIIGHPLKLSSPIQKADSIIVLGGGVGESGKAAQGYEERVEYGVELYKNGYAPNIVFSSGFKYAVKEVSIMKALAESLGVPKEAIVLEEDARNTYENIKFSHSIALAKHWKKVIIISSPYHMLRVSLVCRKNAPDIQSIYAPIPHSLFYGDEKQVYLRHVVAILHEYMGIAYYYIRGWI